LPDSLFYKAILDRFTDHGFENRLEGETGALTLLENIDFNGFLFGSLEYMDNALVVKLGPYIFKPHTAFIYYFAAYGVFVLLCLLAHYIFYFVNLVQKINSKSFALFILFLMLFYSLGEVFIIIPFSIFVLEMLSQNKIIKYNS